MNWRGIGQAAWAKKQREQLKAAKRAWNKSLAVAAKTRKPPVQDFLQSAEWRRLRFEALRRYGRRCACCGATPESGAILNVDHIKPRKTHPHLALDINNLQILCDACNHGKGNRDDDFRSQ